MILHKITTWKSFSASISNIFNSSRWSTKASLQLKRITEVNAYRKAFRVIAADHFVVGGPLDGTNGEGDLSLTPLNYFEVWYH